MSSMLRTVAAALMWFVSGSISAQVVEQAIPRDPLALDSGKVAGEVLPSGVRTYRGIPFAAPPVRELRWREPQPVLAWKGVYNADRPAPECIQSLRAHDINHYFGEEATSEDCLYLNVWAPPDARGGSRKPVIVWIYGGGFTVGSTNMANYSGEALARKGVVFVSIAYRVGALGFLAHPALTAESAHRASGNYGFLDQLAGLHWVQRNIARFGGDPRNVTVMGQSAGSMSVSVLQSSPLAKGLFARAIGMSGASFGNTAGSARPLAAAEKEGLQLQARLGARDLLAMRNLSADRILQAQMASPMRLGPVVEGFVLPANPEQIFAAGRQIDVPLLLGFTRNDSFGPNDRSASMQMRSWAKAQTATGKAPVYVYEFTRSHPYVQGVAFSDHDPQTAGAYHTSDLPYWFGTLESLNLFRRTRSWTALDRALSDAMSSSIVAFASRGDPNPMGRVDWPTYRADTEQIRELGDVTRTVAWALPENKPAENASLTQRPPVADKPSLGDAYPERRTQFPGGVVSFADLTYSTLQGFRPLTLDLYREERQPKPRPLVIYVHGGGWMSGHTRHSGAFEHWPAVLASLAAKGYVVASIEYRLSGEARYPAAIDDVRASIKWLREHAAEWGIDPKRAVIWGGSAGGQLAALAATSCAVAAECVQGAVAWYGIFDFRTLASSPGPIGGNGRFAPDSAPARYLGCTAKPCASETLMSASPAAHVDANDPPVLLVHGVNDRTVSVEQSRAFYRALRSKGVDARLIEIPGVDHSFVGSTPEATRDASWRALNETFDFIAHVAPPET
jgi:para-nitrobenzyl esterase